MKNLLVLFFLSVCFNIHAQDFINGDLQGNTSAPANVPLSWQNVPFTDPHSLATTAARATCDVTDINGPVANIGLLGNPYSGSTFCSGIYGGQDSLNFSQEGLMQTIPGFSVGCAYSVNFYQAVVKQCNFLMMDSSGCWAVYVDTILIGITNPTLSLDSCNSTSFPWDFRSMMFIATQTSHTIKFLPFDDDNDPFTSNPTGGAVRMGIDSIFIKPFTGIIPFNVFGNDTTLCQGDSLTLNTNTPNATYLWQDNSTDSVFTITQPGTYWVQIFDSCANKTDTIVVDYLFQPSVFLGNDTVLCQGETFTLNVSDPNTNSYLWQDNSTDSVFSINQQGIYWTQLTGVCGIVSDTINVNYNPLPIINLGTDTLLCPFDSLQLNASLPNTTYLWQNNSTDSVFTVSQSGIYWVITDLNNCKFSDSIQISFIELLNLGNDTVLCTGDELTLNANTNSSTYLWQNNTTASSITISQPGTYWVDVSNQCGIMTDTIVVLGENCETIIKLPNTITPNGDGLNDLFSPIFINGVKSLHTTIYNRWGQKIFESEFLKIGWDGRTNAASICPDGTYYWIINYKDINDIINTITGFITLIR